MSALCFESLAGNSNRGVTIRNWGGKPLREPRSAATGPPSSWPLLANHHVTVYHRVTGRSSGNVAGLCSGETRAYLADAYSGDSDDFVGCTLAAKVSGRGQALRGLRVNKSACPTCGASQNPAGLKTGVTEGVKAHDEDGVVVATRLSHSGGDLNATGTLSHLLSCWDEDWFCGFAPAFHFDFAVGAGGARNHAGGVEWGGNVALMVEGDYAAFAILFDQLLHDYVVGCLLERDVEVADAFADIGCDDIAHEEFADACAGDGAAFVVGVGAGADDGRIAHAAGHFVDGASCRGAGCEVAMLVEGDDAYGAVFAHRIVGHRGGFLFVRVCFFFCALVLLPEAFVVEVVGRDKVDALRFGEAFGPGADEHHVRSFFHHEAREVDGIRDVLQGGDGAGGEGFAVHDGGVHFGDAVASVIGASTGIVQAGVFHGADCGFDGIEAGAACGEDRVAFFYGDDHAGAAGFDEFGRGFADIAGAAVGDEDKVWGRGCCGRDWGGVGADCE